MGNWTDSSPRRVSRCRWWRGGRSVTGSNCAHPAAASEPPQRTGRSRLRSIRASDLQPNCRRDVHRDTAVRATLEVEPSLPTPRPVVDGQGALASNTVSWEHPTFLGDHLPSWCILGGAVKAEVTLCPRSQSWPAEPPVCRARGQWPKGLTRQMRCLGQ